MENNINRDEMKIPEHCSQGYEIVEGFGKNELIKASMFAIVGGVIGILTMIFTKQITTVVLSIVIGGTGGYIFCKKDRYSRQSIVDMISDYRNFKKSQKYYEYRR